jgi:hypothetical protein
MVLIGPIRMVCPSASARATRAAPVVPAAPATFSTTTCWPSVADIRSATSLATISVGPPAAKGTTIVMGREGKVWAVAGMAAVAARTAASASLLVITISSRMSGCV